MDMSHFEKIKVLGQGTFGKCYLVHNKHTSQKCVLKQINMQDRSDKEKEDAMKEARILQALDHPSIVKMIGSFKSKGGNLNIVMNYAEGGDMARTIRQAKGTYFSENQILNWFTQLCLALKHVHDRKIIHRDIKCQNIFLTKDKLIKLGDFGIAKSINQTFEKLKSVVGTPYYMSPEICNNTDYSFKTDIWSLGVVLYEMCALKPPFEAISLAALALKIMKGEYNPLPACFSKEIKKLIGEMLMVDPARRPSVSTILKNPLLKSRIANYVTKSSSTFTRQSELADLLQPAGNESERTKKLRVGSVFSPQNPPHISFPQSPSYFPVQTPQNKNISISSKFKENNSYQKNKEVREGQEKNARRAMRRREISQPNLAARMMQGKLQSEKNEAKLKRNGFSSNVQLDKKRSEDSANCRKPKRSKKIEESTLSTNMVMEELEEIKKFHGEVKVLHEKVLHQRVETIDRQMTARQLKEGDSDNDLPNYPIEELQEILYEQDEEESNIKELEMKESVYVVMQKYSGKEEEVEFNYETQAETLKCVLEQRLGSERLTRVLEILKRAKGFPTEQQIDPVLNKDQQREMLGLAVVYSYYVECE